MPRVIVTQPLSPERLAPLADACELCVLDEGKRLAPELLADADGILCLLTDRIDRALLASAPQLGFVSSVSVGVDHIDVAALSERAIPVGHTPGVLVDTTADLTLALMLAAARRVAEADRFVRGGQWTAEERWTPTFFLGRDVSGATLGLVGLGAIGQAVARRAAGFGMHILGWTPSGREVPGVTNTSLDELLSRSDFVSVHVALVNETRNLIDAARISAMKPGSILVNTARGGIVDEAALALALDEGHLHAAGLDVYAQEPLAAGSPLLRQPRVVFAPHIGSATPRTRARMVDLAVANALAALRGEPMPHCANAAVYRG